MKIDSVQMIVEKRPKVKSPEYCSTFDLPPFEDYDATVRIKVQRLLYIKMVMFSTFNNGIVDEEIVESSFSNTYVEYWLILVHERWGIAPFNEEILFLASVLPQQLLLVWKDLHQPHFQFNFHLFLLFPFLNLI